MTFLEILINFVNFGILLGLAPILTCESFPDKIQILWDRNFLLPRYPSGRQ